METASTPRAPLLGDWMREGHLNMVYAPTGVGKSFFALACAIAIAGGGEAFGWRAPAPRKVLLVDGEMDREDIAQRARLLIAAAPGVDREAAADNLQVMAYQDQAPDTWFPNIAEPAGQDVVAQRARETKAALVILDNFSTLAQVEDENAANAIDPIVELLRRLKREGCAVMLVHHSKKSMVGQDGSYRGSSKIGVTFQSIIRLAAPQERRPGVAFSLTFEKVRDLRTDEHASKQAHLPAPQGGSSEAPRWIVEEDQGPLLERLVAAVRSRQYLTQKDIADALEVSTGGLSSLKTRAVAAGLITTVEWRQCMSDARELASDESAEPGPF
jgi:RecA-family ATPase